MKEEQIIDSIKQKQLDKEQRIKALGWGFLMIALMASFFAYFSSTDTMRNYFTFSNDELESYYMMSGLLAVMGLFCLNSLKHPI